MERTERFYKIEMSIRSRGCVSFVDLMTELAVSRATLKRDLEFLRTRMEAPIVYDRAANGYQLQPRPARPAGRKSAKLASQAPATLTWFSERELHTLLSMRELIGQLDARGTIARHLRPLQDRLHGLLGASEAEARELIRRVRISNPLQPQAGPGFELIGRALTERRRLRLQVQAQSQQDVTSLEVSPQRLVEQGQNWCLDAWCHASRAICRIELTQVVSAEILDERARDVALRSVESALDDQAAATEQSPG
jgi:predicted DNA-binding transcriptional regulator YafY